MQEIVQLWNRIRYFFSNLPFYYYFIPVLILSLLVQSIYYGNVSYGSINSAPVEFVSYPKIGTIGSFNDNGKRLTFHCSSIHQLNLPICESSGIFLQDRRVILNNIEYRIFENTCSKEDGSNSCEIEVLKASMISSNGQIFLDSTKKQQGMISFVYDFLSLIYLPTLIALTFSMFIHIFFKVWS